MAAFSRRKFLTLMGAGASSTLAIASLEKFYQRAEAGESLAAEGFGALQKDPRGIFNLPPGFQYRILSTTGEMMDDGTPVPKDHDGMAAFPGENGEIILVRNHEINYGQGRSVQAPPEYQYDGAGRGGTTTVILNRDRQLVRHYVSLAGTCRNCAGGVTPWGTWISCEEDNATPQTANVEQKHGYAFEVVPGAPLQKAIPLKAMGRFYREAIAVDPHTGHVYQTEDRNDSCLYRFHPNEPGNLQAGGHLEALAIQNWPQADTTGDFPKKPFAVEWIPLENVDPDTDSLRQEAQRKGAAIFKRGEGICYGQGHIYWSCTSGGPGNRGQIFRYGPDRNQLELFITPPSRSLLEHPDNLTMAPFGDLIVCEDGGGQQFLRGITPEGKYYNLGENALNESELAGVCFAPDGQTLFVNIQRPGITLAIWGNFPQVAS